jgi:cell wall assembly regulator SMI1
VSIERQYRKAERMLKGTPFEGTFRPPATGADLQGLESETGIEVIGGLRDLWLLANGSEYHRYGTPTFCAITDGVIPCGFYSIEEALEKWRDPESEEDFDGVEEDPPRDPRIKAGWVNPRWLPFGDFDGGSTMLYFDADPASRGRHGQILAYQHDPEAIHLLSGSFDRFFWKSNLLLRWSPQMRSWRRGDDA